MLIIYKLVFIGKQSKEFYFCDLCGQVIEYDLKQIESKFHKHLVVPYVGCFSLNEENEITYTNWTGDYHFHPSCYNEKIKPIFIKRKKDIFGHESFTKKGS